MMRIEANPFSVQGIKEITGNILNNLNTFIKDDWGLFEINAEEREKMLEWSEDRLRKWAQIHNMDDRELRRQMGIDQDVKDPFGGIGEYLGSGELTVEGKSKRGFLSRKSHDTGSRFRDEEDHSRRGDGIIKGTIRKGWFRR